MSQFTILDNFKEISHQISALCESRNRPCSERVAAYALRALTLDKNSEFEFEKPLTQKQLRRLIETTSDRIVAQDDPAMETIKMQAAFDGVTLYVDQEMRKNSLLQEEETRKQIDKVVEFAGRMKTDSQVTNLYKLVFDLLAINACVEKVDRNVEREIAAALQSAFPMPRVKAFSAMDNDQRQEQISSLINIVLGIRLFNFSIGKGGAGFSDVPHLLVENIRKLLNEVQEEIKELTPSSELYSGVIRIEFSLPGTISTSLARLQEEFRNRQQYFAYLSRLQIELNEALDLIENAINHYKTELDSLKGLVGARISVPKGEVFPKFDALGRLWRALGIEMERTSAKQTVFQELLKFKASFPCSLCKEDLDLLKDPEIQKRLNEDGASSAQSPEDLFLSNEDGEQVQDSAIRITAEEVARLPNLELEYEGYCPWTIVRRDALLLPGRLEHGLVQYRGRFYAFAHEAAINAFMDAPKTFIKGIEEKVSSAPELIHLLHMEKGFPRFDDITESDGNNSLSYGQEAKTCEVGTETVLHIMEEDKDRASYMWNEWDMRRKALQLVKLRQKRTHGAQTDLSFFKRESETQVYLKQPDKDNVMPGVGTQTGIHASTNTVVRRRYIAGLRGSPQTKMHIVNLTL